MLALAITLVVQYTDTEGCQEVALMLIEETRKVREVLEKHFGDSRIPDGEYLVFVDTEDFCTRVSDGKVQLFPPDWDRRKAKEIR